MWLLAKSTPWGPRRLFVSLAKTRGVRGISFRRGHEVDFVRLRELREAPLAAESGHRWSIGWLILDVGSIFLLYSLIHAFNNSSLSTKIARSQSIEHVILSLLE